MPPPPAGDSSPGPAPPPSPSSNIDAHRGPRPPIPAFLPPPPWPPRSIADSGPGPLVAVADDACREHDREPPDKTPCRCAAAGIVSITEEPGLRKRLLREAPTRPETAHR